MADYKVGKAQKMVLDVLLPGNNIEYWSTAEARFEEFGIAVGARREGRRSVPVVRLKRGVRAAWNSDGDADVWYEQHGLSDEQVAALQPWIAGDV